MDQEIVVNYGQSYFFENVKITYYTLIDTMYFGGYFKDTGGSVYSAFI